MRCPACGEPAGEDERRCPGCGTVLAGRPLLLEPEGAAPPAVRPPAPRARSPGLAPRAIAGIAGAVVAAAVAVVSLTPGGPDAPGDLRDDPIGRLLGQRGIPAVVVDGVGPLLGEASGVVIAVSAPGWLATVDLDTGALVETTSPAALPGGVTLLTVDDHAVVVGGDRAAAVSLRGDGIVPLGAVPLRGLGRAVFPSAVAGRAWLRTSAAPGTLLLREVDVATGRQVRSASLPGPANAFPLAAVDGGLLLAERGTGRRGYGLEVVTADGALLRAIGGPAAVVDARGRFVVWTSCRRAEACRMTVVDLLHGSSGTVAPPDGLSGFLTAGVLSPDGRVLAAHARVAGSADAALVLVDVVERRVEAVLGRLSWSSPLAWSSDGRWLFHLRPGPAPGSLHVVAVPRDGQDAVSLPVAVRGVDPIALALAAG